jgi:hypothetical protein
MAVQRCPSCFLINPPSAMHCDCGHGFGSNPSKDEEFISLQVRPPQTRGWPHDRGFLFTTSWGRLFLLCRAIVRAIVRFAESREKRRKLPRLPQAQARKPRAQ